MKFINDVEEFAAIRRQLGKVATDPTEVMEMALTLAQAGVTPDEIEHLIVVWKTAYYRLANLPISEVEFMMNTVSALRRAVG